MEPQAASGHCQPHAGGNQAAGRGTGGLRLDRCHPPLHSAGEKIYSWWSYRAADWEASDRGRRLDHVWTSPGLKGALKSHKILKKMRGWQKARSCAGDGGAGSVIAALKSPVTGRPAARGFGSGVPAFAARMGHQTTRDCCRRASPGWRPHSRAMTARDLPERVHWTSLNANRFSPRTA